MDEKEITVLVKVPYEKLHEELTKSNFKIVNEYTCEDIYMINQDIDLNKLSNLEILQKCILIRNIEDFETKKQLLYKNKKYDENGSVISQKKIICPIEDIKKAVGFMETINYKALFTISDRCIVYTNNNTELTVQLVNDKYIFIEMEDKCVYVNRNYDGIEDMKGEINKYNIPFVKNNYFVKKGEIVLEEILGRSVRKK